MKESKWISDWQRLHSYRINDAGRFECYYRKADMIKYIGYFDTPEDIRYELMMEFANKNNLLFQVAACQKKH